MGDIRSAPDSHHSKKVPNSSTRDVDAREETRQGIFLDNALDNQLSPLTLGQIDASMRPRKPERDQAVRDMLQNFNVNASERQGSFFKKNETSKTVRDLAEALKDGYLTHDERANIHNALGSSILFDGVGGEHQLVAEVNRELNTMGSQFRLIRPANGDYVPGSPLHYDVLDQNGRVADKLSVRLSDGPQRTLPQLAEQAALSLADGKLDAGENENLSEALKAAYVDGGKEGVDKMREQINANLKPINADCHLETRIQYSPGPPLEKQPYRTVYVKPELVDNASNSVKQSIPAVNTGENDQQRLLDGSPLALVASMNEMPLEKRSLPAAVGRLVDQVSTSISDGQIDRSEQLSIGNALRRADASGCLPEFLKAINAKLADADVRLSVFRNHWQYKASFVNSRTGARIAEGTIEQGELNELETNPGERGRPLFDPPYTNYPNESPSAR